MIVEFSEALTFLTPRIEFQCRRAQTMLKGMEYDDVYQELMLELWKQHSKTPRDMVTYDYRFSRYYERVFRNRIYHIYRNSLRARQKGYYRDSLDWAIPIPEGVEIMGEFQPLFSDEQ